MTKETSTGHSDHLKIVIDGVDISPLYKAVNGLKPDKLVEMAYGRFVVEGLGKMLRRISEVALVCVKLNFDVGSVYDELLKVNSVVKSELVELS